MSKNLIKKVKLNFLDFLKQFSSFLTNKNYPTDNFIKVVEKHEIHNYVLFKRLLAYTYHCPHIIYYFNRYLNNKFDSSHYDLKLFLDSFKYIMNSNNINKLYYFKSQDFKDENKQKIKKLLKDYYNFIENKYLNDLELNHLYLLFCKKIITVDDIIKINKLLNDGTEKLDINFDVLENSNINDVDDETKFNEYLNYSLTKQYTQEVYNYSQSLKELKINREKCKSCKLYSNGFIPFDTNCEKIEHIDFLFIGLNNDQESTVFNKTYFNEGGKLLRKKIFKFNKDIKWMISNIIPCNLNNVQDIGKTDKQIKNFCNECNDFIINIIKTFSPKVIVPIGKHCMDFFNIKGSIIQNSGKITKSNNDVLIIPLVNPTSISKNEGNKSVYDNSWNTLFNISSKLINQTGSTTITNMEIKTLPKTVIQSDDNIVKSTNKYNVDPNKIINVVTENLTYFDSFELDAYNVLNIYTDEHGEKFYKIEEFKIPIYIKNNNFNECNMLESDFSYISFVNGTNRYKLRKALKDNLIKYNYTALNP